MAQVARASLTALTVATVAAGAASHAFPETSRLSEEVIRAEFAGKALEGYYRRGGDWAASFSPDGKYDAREGALLAAAGEWYLRGNALCMFYGPPFWALAERCATVTKVSTNCYEFYLAWPDAERRFGSSAFQPIWHSRGWLLDEPPTCHERPVS